MNPPKLDTQVLRAAYSQGIFPMGDDDGVIDFYRPSIRALFPIEGILVSRSLAKTIRQNRFEIKFDTAYEEVMRGCLRPGDNWITEEIIRAFTDAYHEGWGHCSECWRDGKLVGGVYGLAMGSCFFAESMFHRETDASKVALCALVNKCRELGFTIFDAQIMNPHLKSLGAFEMPNRRFLSLLTKALESYNPWSESSKGEGFGLGQID